MTDILNAQYGNNVLSSIEKQIYPIPINSTRQQPTLSWSSDPSALYTILMVDVDAPSSNNPMYSPFIHWLVVDVTGNDPSTGTTILPYIPPNPPKGSGPHSYYIGVYEQNGNQEVFVNDDQYSNDPLKSRGNFNVNGFIQVNGLHKIADTGFITEYGGGTGQSTQRRRTSSGKTSYRARRLTPQQKEAYFLPNGGLTDQVKKFCRCTLHVGAENLGCGQQGFKGMIDGEECYNPFAVCKGRRKKGTPSIGNPDCTGSYNFSNIPDDELMAYIDARREIKMPQSHDRKSLLDAIATQYVCPEFPNHPICKSR